jgi:hypothetical protein
MIFMDHCNGNAINWGLYYFGYRLELNWTISFLCLASRCAIYNSNNNNNISHRQHNFLLLLLISLYVVVFIGIHRLTLHYTGQVTKYTYHAYK